MAKKKHILSVTLLCLAIFISCCAATGCVGQNIVVTTDETSRDTTITETTANIEKNVTIYYTSDPNGFCPPEADGKLKTERFGFSYLIWYVSDSPLPCVYYGFGLDAESFAMLKTEFEKPDFEYEAYSLISISEAGKNHAAATVDFVKASGEKETLKYTLDLTLPEREPNDSVAYTTPMWTMVTDWYTEDTATGLTDSELSGNTTEINGIIYEQVRAEWEKLITDSFNAPDTTESCIEWRTDFVIALLSGDGTALAKAVGIAPEIYACYNGIVISDWSVRMITIDNYYGYKQDFTVLDLTVESSNAPSLPAGNHSIVLEDGIWRRFRPLDSLNAEPKNHSSAEDYVKSLICYSPQYGTCHFIVRRLEELAGNAGYYMPRTGEEIKEYAEICLGIDPDSLEIDKQLQKVDGGYIAIGTAGGFRAADMLGEEKRGDTTVVTVRYFADPSMSVEARVVEYHLEKAHIDWKLIDHITISDSGFSVFCF